MKTRDEWSDAGPYHPRVPSARWGFPLTTHLQSHLFTAVYVLSWHKGVVSPRYFCPAGTNLAEVNTGCCCLAAVCRWVPFWGRHTCRMHGCRMTQQLSDHWWQVGEPGWHTGPLIVRPLICLYRRSVFTPPGCQECSVNPWMDNKRLKCTYCQHQTQNICLRSVPLVQPHAMRRQSVAFLINMCIHRNVYFRGLAEDILPNKFWLCYDVTTDSSLELAARICLKSSVMPFFRN